VLLRGTITIDRPAASSNIEAIVAAIRAAMIAATSELADRVAAAVEKIPPPPTEQQQAASR